MTVVLGLSVVICLLLAAFFVNTKSKTDLLLALVFLGLAFYGLNLLDSLPA